MEAEKQQSDNKIYQEVSNSQIILLKLAEMSNKMFHIVSRRQFISEKNNQNTFAMNIEKWQRLVNFISFQKFKGSIMSQGDHLFQIVVHIQRTDLSFEFLDNHLKSLIQKGWSYINNKGDFMKKTLNLGIVSENAILVTTDTVGLYPSIPYETGLKALRKVLDQAEEHAIPTK